MGNVGISAPVRKDVAVYFLPLLLAHAWSGLTENKTRHFQLALLRQKCNYSWIGDIIPKRVSACLVYVSALSLYGSIVPATQVTQ